MAQCHPSLLEATQLKSDDGRGIPFPQYYANWGPPSHSLFCLSLSHGDGPTRAAVLTHKGEENNKRGDLEIVFCQTSLIGLLRFKCLCFCETL